MKTKIKNKIFLAIQCVIVCALIFVFDSGYAFASDNTDFSQAITGSLDVKVVDATGVEVPSPSVVFDSKAFSTAFQTSDATLGTASQRLRVTNPSGVSGEWNLAIATSGGSTATWSDGAVAYDYNDNAASAGDGADADSVGGQMSVNPSAGTISGIGGSSTSNISKGSSDSFVEGVTDSIDLMTASGSAQKPGGWDLIGVDVSQTIPAMQAASSGYEIEMVLTAS